MIMISSVFGALSSANRLTNSSDKENTNMPYTHTVTCEFFTLTTCVPCKFSHQALKNIYEYHEENLGYHPFYYITYVYDANTYAENRKEELFVIGSPTIVWDGDYRRDTAPGSDIETCEETFNESISVCGNRNDVKDIDLSLDVEWLGAVNEDPADDEFEVIVETNLSWTISAMNIDVSVTNNEGSQYNGHLHVHVTEVNSTYWDDKFGNPYTFALLDYAWNKDVTLSGGGTWSDSYIWDGIEHHNGLGEYYDEIYQDNTMVIASVFDEDNDDYTDETAGVRAGDGTNPKTFDLYFGNTTSPPQIKFNTSERSYDPPGNLEFSTEYFWKIDVWDAQGNPTYGDIFKFTTRNNSQPTLPSQESPINNSQNHPIDINLSWFCEDPDNDDLSYDVYFGEDELNLPLVKPNQTETVYDPSPNDQNLDFNKKYYWRIVAWDEYGLNTTGDIWNFRTELNKPPNQAKDEYPPDGDPAAPTILTLRWNGTDPNSGDTLFYDVYFDDVNPPTYQREWNISVEEWKVPFEMPKYATYYWRIDTWDKSGEYAGGKIWQFTTGDNNPPTNPFIDGPSQGVPEESYTFTFVSTDPESHDIRYEVDWGDGVVDNTNLVPSGQEVTLTHTWDPPPRTVTISATAIDEHYAESGVSLFEFTLPRKKVFNFNLLEWLFERFPNAFPILRQLLGL